MTPWDLPSSSWSFFSSTSCHCYAAEMPTWSSVPLLSDLGHVPPFNYINLNSILILELYRDIRKNQEGEKGVGRFLGPQLSYIPSE